MSLLLTMLSECLTPRKPAITYTIEEKSQFNQYNDSQQTDKEIATRVVNLLIGAKLNDDDLQITIQTVVREQGWTESLAAAILAALQKALELGITFGGVMKDAVEKAVHEAGDFAKEHPVYVTIIVLGVLVTLLPWVIETLGFWSGFGELGPIEGSWAALWQSRYVGYVPKGSLFSFFQRLGMVWRRIV